MPVFDTAVPLLVLSGVLGYLLGSIPFGIVITRAMGLGDLRKIGSGNIGATNVLRTGNKPAAAATLLLDALKGGIAVLIARLTIGEDAAQIAGFCAFLGHLFPVWLGFRGGKGVATFFGTLLFLAWPVGLAACATWLLVAKISRISSLSALVAGALSPVFAVLTGHTTVAVLCALMYLLILIRHEANIRRIIAGTEPKIGAKKS